jgi:hypothetical protein
MIDRSDSPPVAALVAWPGRREWPAYFAAPNPARHAVPINPGTTFDVGSKPRRPLAGNVKTAFER